MEKAIAESLIAGRDAGSLAPQGQRHLCPGSRQPDALTGKYSRISAFSFFSKHFALAEGLVKKQDIAARTASASFWYCLLQ